MDSCINVKHVDDIKCHSQTNENPFAEAMFYTTLWEQISMKQVKKIYIILTLISS